MWRSEWVNFICVYDLLEKVKSAIKAKIAVYSNTLNSITVSLIHVSGAIFGYKLCVCVCWDSPNIFCVPLKAIGGKIDILCRFHFVCVFRFIHILFFFIFMVLLFLFRSFFSHWQNHDIETELSAAPKPHTEKAAKVKEVKNHEITRFQINM